MMPAMMLRPLVLACVLAAGLSAPAPAQKPGARSPAQYEQDLDLGRTLPFLAYTLGELHYLAYACEGDGAQQWRERMVELLAMEASDDGRRRDRLIESFNEGYRSQQRYRARCGAEADAERRALAHRGRDLSEMMRSAYFD
jgi:uncharacterized protein (TIGR02301 family)